MDSGLGNDTGVVSPLKKGLLEDDDILSHLRLLLYSDRNLFGVLEVEEQIFDLF